MLRYRQRYQAEGKEMGKLEFQDLNIDLLSRRSAVVTGKWQLTMSDGKQPHGLFTLIFKRLRPDGKLCTTIPQRRSNKTLRHPEPR